MKSFVSLATEEGGSDRPESPMAIIDIDEDGIENLRRMRQVIQVVADEARRNRRTFAAMYFHTMDVHWLLVMEEETDKLYMAAAASEDGFKTIPQDVHDQRLRTAEEDSDELMMRTENDYVCMTERGVYYVCEEKHSYTRFESQFMPWHVLFDEPPPAVERDPYAEAAFIAAARDRMQQSN